MSEAAGPVSTVASAGRCSYCGTAVVGTRHTRSGYEVGHYVLHGGRTTEASIRRHDDEEPIIYRRLTTTRITVACPTCFARPEIRRRWTRFDDGEPGSPEAA